jgi:hypothetical protein
MVHPMSEPVTRTVGRGKPVGPPPAGFLPASQLLFPGTSKPPSH